ncbi:MAG TPA: YCF48-related protein [Roseiarcus sp.]|nr:YCF48-related protein [Roseiarcus sp.]
MTQTLYAGLAGDTDDGRFVSAGLYRSVDGGAWTRIDGGFEERQEVRAILTDARQPDRAVIGSQSGIFLSDDRGDSWRHLSAPRPELSVWSLVRDPSDPDVIFAGYEPATLYRSPDDGKTWTSIYLPATYPHVTAGPEMPKRITGIAVAGASRGEIYLSVEVGGLLRSLEGGKHWGAAIDGLYVVEDAVDLHGVVVSPTRREQVTVTTRIGAFRSDDHGDHWRKLPVPALREKGSYCRAIAYAPGRPQTLFLGAGNDFDGDKGALFVSGDNGATWRPANLPGPLKSTVFAIAINSRLPQQVHCATKNGGVFSSMDGGESWTYAPLPRGAGHVFSLGLG